MAADNPSSSDKIDALLSKLTASEIEILVNRVQQFRSAEPSSQPTKRSRPGSGSDWATVVRGNGNQVEGAMSKEVNEPTQVIPPGFPVVLKNIPAKLGKNTLAISKALKHLCPDLQVKSQKLSAETNRLIIYPVDCASSNMLLDANLSGSDLEGATITQAQQTRGKLAVLIAGVEPSIPEKDIANELTERGIYFTEVHRMKASSGDSTYKVKVTLSDPQQKYKLLENGVYLGYTRHRVLDFKELPNVLVCFHCQEFGHYAKDCQQEVVCVRCGANHSVKDCPVSEDHPRCYHCTGYHSSAYKGCPIYKEKQRELVESRAKKQAATKPSSKVSPPNSQGKVDFDNILNVLVEVLFTTFEKFCPCAERVPTVLLSDLSQHVSEAMTFHTKQTFSAPDVFSRSKSRLRSLGFLQPAPVSV